MSRMQPEIVLGVAGGPPRTYGERLGISYPSRTAPAPKALSKPSPVLLQANRIDARTEYPRRIWIQDSSSRGCRSRAGTSNGPSGEAEDGRADPDTFRYQM